MGRNHFKLIVFSILISLLGSCRTMERTISPYYDTEISKTNPISQYVYTPGQPFRPGGLYLIKENPEKGFYWPFFIKIPTQLDQTNHIVLSTSNSGRRSKDFNFDEQIEWTGLHSWLPYIQIMPVLDRSARLEDRHGLLPQYLMGAEILHTKWAEHYRVDQQVVHMLKEARRLLQQSNIDTFDKYYIYGYSGSAFFATRFVSLHPEIIRAAAYGGHYWTVVPVEEYESIKLSYNYGVADYLEETGKPFDAAAFEDIPQFIFMGENDDPIGPIHWPGEGRPGQVSPQYVRSFSAKFGETAADLFHSYKEIFEKSGYTNAVFKLYGNANHTEANELSYPDILHFFNEIDRLVSANVDSVVPDNAMKDVAIPYRESDILLSSNEQLGNGSLPAVDITGIEIAQSDGYLFIYIKLADPRAQESAWYQTNFISQTGNEFDDAAIRWDNGRWITELRKIESGSMKTVLIEEAYAVENGLIGRIPLTSISSLGTSLKPYSHIYNGGEEDQTATKFLELK